MAEKVLINKEGLLKIQELTPYGDLYADDNIIRAFKERELKLDKPVFVYRNLHFKKKRIYSIKQGGQVVAHAERLCLSDCDFIVNKKGREKIVKTKSKFPCAYIKGTLVGSGMGTTSSGSLNCIITFDPYINDTFVCKNITLKGIKVFASRFTILSDKVTTAYIDKSESL